MMVLGCCLCCVICCFSCWCLGGWMVLVLVWCCCVRLFMSMVVNCVGRVGLVKLCFCFICCCCCCSGF